jgi:NitT/TauT family transport system ATP-binding protein
VDITVTDLSKAYGEKTVLRSFSAVFPGGQTVCVMGDSGVGKTTLLHILMGLFPADSGSIRGLENRRISAVFQEDRLCESFSAVTNVRLPGGQGASRERAIAHLSALGLANSLSQPVRELSGGMRRRVAVARAILAGGEVFLLDEPLNGLDEQSKATTAAYILEHTKGAGVIMVTHSRAEVELMNGSLLLMRDAGGGVYGAGGVSASGA